MLGVQSAGPRLVQAGAATRVSDAASGSGFSSGRLAPEEPRPAGERTWGGRDRSDPGPARADIGPEKEAWVVLLAVPGLGPVTFARLLATFGSARAVLSAAAGSNGAAVLSDALAEGGGSGATVSAAESESEPGAPARDGVEAAAPGGRRARGAGHGVLSPDLARRIVEQAAGSGPALAIVRDLGLVVLTLDDPEYPERLRRVDMPPPLLFVRGSLESLSAPSAVAVVGTRRPTDRGRRIAGWIGSALARAGAVVVSGLAVGVDGAAHAAVVAEGMPTVAILGGGHARLFPKAHERLADAIVASGGAVVAEFPPETPATKGTFPRRNRVVSGLSDATVVVEAGRRSGALITAGWALEQGRGCFLVPGPLDAPTSEGCHLFLRSFEGEARLVCGIPELLEDLGLAGSAGQPDRIPPGSPVGRSDDRAAARIGRGGAAPSSAVRGAGPDAVVAGLGPVERAVALQLVEGPASADALAGRCNLTGAAVLSALTLLELRGLAVGSYGRYMAVGALAGWPRSIKRP
jgi:DNA processing protein